MHRKECNIDIRFTLAVRQHTPVTRAMCWFVPAAESVSTFLVENMEIGGEEVHHHVHMMHFDKTYTLPTARNAQCTQCMCFCKRPRGYF